MIRRAFFLPGWMANSVKHPGSTSPQTECGALAGYTSGGRPQGNRTESKSRAKPDKYMKPPKVVRWNFWMALSKGEFNASEEAVMALALGIIVNKYIV